MKGQYESLDRNNKPIWNFRDIGTPCVRFPKGAAGQILCLIHEPVCRFCNVNAMENWTKALRLIKNI